MIEGARVRLADDIVARCQPLYRLRASNERGTVLQVHERTDGGRASVLVLWDRYAEEAWQWANELTPVVGGES